MRKHIPGEKYHNHIVNKLLVWICSNQTLHSCIMLISVLQNCFLLLTNVQFLTIHLIDFETLFQILIKTSLGHRFTVIDKTHH